MMADPAALQEAIQRARQLAAKISHKRPASEMLSDSREIGTVKVTHAYEKPIEPRPPRDSSRDHRDQRDQRLDNNQRDSHRDHRESRDGSGGGGGQRESRGEHRESRDNRDNRDSREPREHRELSNSRDTIQRDAGGGGMLPMSGIGGGGGGNYSRGASDDKIDIIIPHAVIGLVIGKGGENIKRIQNETGATVRVDPNTVDEKGNKVCTITGTRQAVEEAHNQVANVIENASTNKRPRMAVEGTDQYRMKIPASRTGAIIGKGGETIKSIKQQSGCDIELDKGSKDCGPEESVFIIRGTQDRISKAKTLIEARLASRGRDNDGPRSGGGGSGGGSSSFKSGVATGANAAPVAPYTDLPATYPGKLFHILKVMTSDRYESVVTRFSSGIYLAQHTLSHTILLSIDLSVCLANHTHHLM